MLDALDLSGTWSLTMGTRAGLSIFLPNSIDCATLAPAGKSAGSDHLTRRNPFVGCAVYERTFAVTAAQAGHMATLVLERTHGRVSVALDGAPVGRDLTLCTSTHMLLGQIKEGEHTLTVTIDNSDFPAVGEALHDLYPDVAHSTSDHTQTNWNGIIGEIALHFAPASIAKLDIASKGRTITVSAELESFDHNNLWPTAWEDGGDDQLNLRVTLADGTQIERTLPAPVSSGLAEIECEIDLPDTAALWDEFSPTIHTLTATWMRGDVVMDTRTEQFGLREIETRGRHILLNGRRIFLRGTLDCAIFPLTGYPPMDVESWAEIFATIKAHGLNHIRFHSWCPPRAAFQAADKAGLYLHVETPVWCVLGTDPELDQFVRNEAERIVQTYGNHPSFTMLYVGNEVAGPGLHGFLERFTRDWKKRDPRRLYGGGSGWPTIANANYSSKPEPRSHQWGDGLTSRLNAKPLETKTDWSAWVEKVDHPLVGHEIGQWCAYPDLSSAENYAGALAPDAFHMVANDLAHKKRLDKADAYMRNSGALQFALYKEDIEASLRTPNYGGFQMLGLQDFTGQGTALVGVVDAFWQPKPYNDPAKFSQFCGPVVPLIRAESFTLTKGDTFEAQAQVSLFAPTDIAAGAAAWSLCDLNGDILIYGEINHPALKTGDLIDLGNLAFSTSALEEGQYLLTLQAAGGLNSWDIWVFSPPKETNLPLTKKLDGEAIMNLVAGETIVFCPDPDAIIPNAELGHTTIFWNTNWTFDQAPHTLGLINHLAHDLFAQFPAQEHTGWHQWSLSFGRCALDVEGLPVTPMISVIDDWNKNRDLVLLAEIRVGAGRLILSAVDLYKTSDAVIGCLAKSLQHYLASGHQAKTAQIEPAQLIAWTQRTLKQ